MFLFVWLFVFSQLPTCDVVHSVERSCVVQVNSKQDHEWHEKSDQQIDWNSKGPVSAKRKKEKENNIDN